MDDCRRWLPSLRSSSFSRRWYWSLVIFPGKFISLSVGDGVVWGLGSNRDLFYRHADYLIIFVFCQFLNQFWFKVLFYFYKTRYVKGLRRSGIDKNTGNNWLRVEQPKETKIVFKQVLAALIMFIILTVMMKLRQCLLQQKARLKCAGTLWSGLTRTTTSSSRPRLAQMSKVALSIWLAWDGYKDTTLSKTIDILFSFKDARVLRKWPKTMATKISHKV